MLKELNKTSFLKEVDFSKAELESLIDLAMELKFKEKH